MGFELLTINKISIISGNFSSGGNDQKLDISSVNPLGRQVQICRNIIHFNGRKLNVICFVQCGGDPAGIGVITSSGNLVIQTDGGRGDA